LHKAVHVCAAGKAGNGGDFLPFFIEALIGGRFCVVESESFALF
jgi:hypothetical protein